MIKLSKQTKLSLFNVVKSEEGAFTNDPEGGILFFLDDIWPLATMQSQDGRFNDAYGDIYQHVVNNDDWDYDYLFLTRLQLLSNDAIFIRFTEAVVNPKHRASEDEIMKFVFLINPHLEKENFTFNLVDYNDKGLPIYEVQEKSDDTALPLDVKKNTIPFFVAKSLTGRADRARSHQTPTEFPCFVLAFNSGWNDFDYRTTFSLYYYENVQPINIGEMKCMSTSVTRTVSTAEVIDNHFLILGADFCSVGQSYEYYLELKRRLGVNFLSVLYALKDAAFFSGIYERFETDSVFLNSLIRSNDIERLVRQVKYRLYGYDLLNLYKFEYNFTPAYSNTPVTVNFDFSRDGALPNRIYSIIGKNGTGKTQLITSLPLNISGKKDECFTPQAPMFSKVIAVSYSVFDNFHIPKRTSSFNYIYCGLRQENNEEITERGRLLRFHRSWKRLQELDRIDQWKKILENFIDSRILDEFILPKQYDNGILLPRVSIEAFNKIKDMFSSGQSIILYIITEITANIRYDSLLLYDEPETHLHPNAITQLINTIYELVNEFQSYCIIATHSPLVIRELLSRSVYVLERNENVPSIRKIGIESFGENLSVLTDEVFGNRSVKKQYKKILNDLVDAGKTFDEIVNLVEDDNAPLSLNAKLFLQGLIKQKYEKP